MKEPMHELWVLGMIFFLGATWLPRTATAEQTGPGGAAEHTGKGGSVGATEASDLAGAVAESSAYRDEVLSTAARHPDRPYLYRQIESTWRSSESTIGRKQPCGCIKPK